MSLEDNLKEDKENKLIVIAKSENSDIKLALNGLDYIVAAPSDMFLDQNPKFAVYVAEDKPLAEDDVFYHLLKHFKDTYFFVLHKYNNSKNKKKFSHDESKRISEFDLDTISNSRGKLKFKNLVEEVMYENEFKPVDYKDIVLYMDGDSDYFKRIKKVMNELGVESIINCSTYEELKSNILRDPALVIVGQENIDDMKKLKQDYKGKKILVAEREKVEQMEPNGVITLSTEPDKSFKDTLRETIKLCMEVVNTKDKKMKVALLDSKKTDNSLFIITGPTCAGKSSIIDCYIKKNDDSAIKVIEATDRKKRPGEIDDVDMIFLSKKEFESWKSIKGLFMHTYSRNDKGYTVNYGILKNMLDYLYEGYDVFLQTKELGLVADLMKEKSIAEKIVPILVTSDTDTLKHRFFERKDMLSRLTSVELKQTSKRFDNLEKEEEEKRAEYIEMIKQYGFTAFNVLNNFSLDRAVNLVTNISNYIKIKRSSGLTFADSIAKKISGLSFSELKADHTKELYEVDKKSIDLVISDYVQKSIISKDEESNFYHLLRPLTEFKIVNVKSESAFGEIELDFPNKKKIKDYKELSKFLEAKEIVIREVLFKVIKTHLDYNNIEDEATDTSKMNVNVIYGKESYKRDGLILSISDPLVEGLFSSTIKTVSIYLKDLINQ